MVGRREQGRLGESFARAGDVENDFMAGAIDARHPHAAGNDFKKSGGLVAEPEQRFAGFQFPVNGSGAHRGGEPIFVRHDLPHRNSLTARLSPIQLSNSQDLFKRASSPVFFAAPGTPSSPLFPGQNAEGVERQAAHQSSVVPHPLVKDAGASRRSTAAFSFRRRAALSDVPFRLASGSELRPLLGGRSLRASGKPQRPAVSELLAGGS